MPQGLACRTFRVTVLEDEFRMIKIGRVATCVLVDLMSHNTHWQRAGVVISIGSSIRQRYTNLSISLGRDLGALGAARFGK